MPTLDGSHSQPGGRKVAFHVEYDVQGPSIHYRAVFDGGRARQEGQFDFDAGKLDAAEAVSAYLQNHIGKADFDVAP